jgi:hypothetical protein
MTGPMSLALVVSIMEDEVCDSCHCVHLTKRIAKWIWYMAMRQVHIPGVYPVYPSCPDTCTHRNPSEREQGNRVLSLQAYP